ncbi:hypothetical protein DK661_15315 [Salmonella enterica subsp. enterica serovar Kentucky]|nr:hypothetical protein [Salmonella enterica subsp. enterica serovar Kentucky]
MQVLPPGSTGGPSRLFILRPVATTLLMAAILLAGIIGYRFLPVAALPEVDYPTIQVVTLYPGASPDVMTSAVTAPLERQFGQMSGLKQMSSQSSGGASVVTLQFQLTLPLDVAEQEVQAAINAATNLLPSDLPNPPIYSKVNPADPPIMTLAVTSNAMPMTQVEDMVETRVAQKISQVSGVGLVTLAGGQRPAVRVKLNAQAIAALGLTSETVRTAITGANVNSAKGSLDGPERAVTLSANDQMQSADEYRKLIIAYQNGAPVRLGDVATVEQGAENSWLGAWANQAPAIVMNVQRQPGANIIATADSIRQMLPQLTESLPKSVKVTVLSDRTTNIRASVRDTQFELMLAIALVVMIIYLFLRNIPATIIPGVAVPLSAIARIEQRFAPLSINHLDQFPVTTFSFNVPEGYSLGDAVQAILDTEKTLALPADITTQFQGSTLAFQAALGSTVWLIVAAVVAMYIVLGVLYESFIHPITILSTLPTAGVGALLALIIAGSELDIIAIIGIILLIGIVKKNAIMMIDFALAAEREQGMSPRDAIFQACLLRFRPILMTTLAALLGALPLMLSTGVGAELRRPLGIAMVGGLLVSQVLTLFTTPVIYLLFDRLSLYVKSRFPRHKEEA